MHNVSQATVRIRPIAALGAVLVALAACDRPASSPTAGQTIDNATARIEQKATEAKDDAKATASEVAQGAERMAGDASSKVKDAAITTAVNAKIAADARLSVMHINVDTVDGRVLLRGNAPDASASDRARELAASVEGVVSVDNQLVIGGKG